MKITSNLNAEARFYYDSVQLRLSQDLELCIVKDDMVFSFLNTVKGVNLKEYVRKICSNNTNSMLE